MSHDLRRIMKVADRPPFVMVEGKGSWLWDSEGRKYLDFVQGWAVNCLGHSPDIILDALNDQARRLLNCSPAYYNEPMARLATLIADSTGLDEVFLCNSGAEANEGAIKLARKWGSRHRGGAFQIVTMEHGFHGRTLATMAASGKPGWDTLFQPRISGFPKVPLGDLEAVRKAVTPETVAVMLEPIQGEAGVFVAADDWLRDLRKLTRDLGILLILDEIQTGIGRTGRMYGYEHAGIEPDIVTLGKGLGGGTPIAALVASAGASVFEYGDQGGTFNGNALMAAVGCAVVTAVRAPGFLYSVGSSGSGCVSTLLLDVVARDPPRAVFVEHGRDGLDGGGLVLEGRLVLDDDVFPVGRAGQGTGEGGGLEGA